MENEQVRLMRENGTNLAHSLVTGLKDIAPNDIFCTIRVRNMVEYGAVREADMVEESREAAISLMMHAGYGPDETDIFGQNVTDDAQTFLMDALLLMPRIMPILAEMDRARYTLETVISGEPVQGHNKRIPLEQPKSDNEDGLEEWEKELLKDRRESDNECDKPHASHFWAMMHDIADLSSNGDKVANESYITHLERLLAEAKKERESLNK